MSIIYKITNKINNKVYIGQTVKSLSRRKQEHKCSAENGSGYYLHRAIRRYGIDSFEWEVLFDGKVEKDELNEKEKYFIDYYNSHFSNGKGYNLTLGGDGNCGWIPTIETRMKISKSNSGKNHPLFGKKMSEERRNNISKGLMGHFVSELTKKRVGEIRRGVPLPEETKQKMSDAHKGKKFTDEHKKKIGDSKRGIKRPDVSERNRKYTDDQHMLAIKMKRKGNSIKDISDTINVPYSTVKHWLMNKKTH